MPEPDIVLHERVARVEAKLDTIVTMVDRFDTLIDEMRQAHAEWRGMKRAMYAIAGGVAFVVSMAAKIFHL